MDQNNKEEQVEDIEEEVNYVRKVRSLNLTNELATNIVKKHKENKNDKVALRLCIAVCVCAEADKNKEIKTLVGKELNKKDEAVVYADNLIKKGIIEKLEKNKDMSERVKNNVNFVKSCSNSTRTKQSNRSINI